LFTCCDQDLACKTHQNYQEKHQRNYWNFCRIFKEFLRVAGVQKAMLGGANSNRTNKE
jgi:hypothetical protein